MANEITVPITLIQNSITAPLTTTPNSITTPLTPVTNEVTVPVTTTPNSITTPLTVTTNKITIPITLGTQGPQGIPGTTLHAELTDTDTDGHPIAAIDGLQTALDGKEPADVTILKDADIGVTVAAALGADDNYVTDAEKIVIGNTSGTNTGDNPGVTSVTGTSPVVSSGGTTPAISIPAATNTIAGHATAAHIQAIEANTAKVSNVDHPLVETAVPIGAVFTDTTYDHTDFISQSYTYTTSLTITVNDADFIVRDTTDTLTEFIWRDHSAGLLYLGSENALVTFRSDVDVASKKLALTGALTLTATLDSAFKVNQTITNNTGVAISAIQAYPTFNGTGQNPIAVDVEPTFSPNVTNTSTNALAIVNTVAPGSGINITASYGLNIFNKFSDVAGSAGTSVSLQVSTPIATGALKPTSQYGTRISNQGVTGITNAYGLYVSSQSGATNNYAAVFAGGNVGVGTETPSTPLHVKGSVTIETPSTYTTQRKDIIRLRDSTPDRVVVEKGSDLNNGNFGLIVSPGSTTVDVQTAFNLWTKDADIASDYHYAGGKLLSTGEYNIFNYAIGAYTAAPITFSISGSEKMRIHSDGNVGIGVTTPLAKLHIGGAVISTQFKLSSLNTAPASSSDTGTLGEIRVTASYVYVCIATDTWVRTALTTW